MAKNGAPGTARIGPVKGRSPFEHRNGNWVKRDTETGRFMDQKTSSPLPFKGVTKEKNTGYRRGTWSGGRKNDRSVGAGCSPCVLARCRGNGDPDAI